MVIHICFHCFLQVLSNFQIYLFLDDFSIGDVSIKQEDSLNISETDQEAANKQEEQSVSENTKIFTSPIFNFETEETKQLSTPELQRLVLLEQLKLTRLQIAKEISAML